MKRSRFAMFAWATFCFVVAAPACVSPCEAPFETQLATPPLAPLPDPPLYTLHAYANLVQVPTLVLSWRSKPLPLIARERFAIRLDGGRAFHPTAMHIEGNDALDLAVLLDASGDQKVLLEHFDDALAAIAQTSLLSHDHVTLYAVDCSLVRAIDVTAENPESIKSAVTAVLSSPGLHGARAARCSGAIHLFDALGQIGHSLADSASRRVILFIGDGGSDKSTHSLAEIRSYLAPHGVAVFAIHQDLDTFAVNSSSAEEKFRLMCESTGGMSLNSSAATLEATLRRFVSLLRGRYILEFPRPSDHLSGNHEMEITIPGTQDFVVHTGALVPPVDPSMLTGPTVIPTAQSPATFGPRHPILPRP